MGLLDEAIREHLELKRRRGGDPTEIAREEHEALAPVFGEAPASADGTPPAPAEESPPAEDPAYAEPNGHPEDRQPAELPRAEGFSSVGQETAELDMQSVLGSQELHTEEHPAPPAPEPEEDFGWEAPGAADAPPEPGPGQERLSFE